MAIRFALNKNVGKYYVVRLTGQNNNPAGYVDTLYGTVFPKKDKDKKISTISFNYGASEICDGLLKFTYPNNAYLQVLKDCYVNAEFTKAGTYLINNETWYSLINRIFLIYK